MSVLEPSRSLFRRLVLGGEPSDKFGVPSEADFDRVGQDFIPAQGCEKIAQKLIETLKRFEPLRECAITYLWKRKGATSPRMVLGKCQRLAGLLKYYAGAEFVIWFSANNCTYANLTNWQMEALIFHELCHATMEGSQAVLVPHDLEVFADEISRYGPWKDDIALVAKAVLQLGLKLDFDKSEGS